KKKPESAVKSEQAKEPIAIQKTQKAESKQAEETVPPVKSDVISSPSTAVPEVQQAASPIEKPKISIQTLKSVPSIIPNLNDLSGPVVKAEEDTPKYVSGESRNPFTSDELLRLWNSYAADMKKT